MPRIGALLSLSREHHTSLVMARDARRATSSNDAAVLSAAVEQIERHWHMLLAVHFEQEERLIQVAKDTLDPVSVERILTEHAELRMLGAGPCQLEPAERLRRFADLLRAHVRYEERAFFPQLQSHPCVANTDTHTHTDAADANT
ncbi:hypothetical protein [Nitrosovibrio sp. Nv4]|uniref:hypothetical protein n=1 Tax=Nitrosovibrio sp. Nv4 TaxID=1945880 RepID=UPI000BC50667|nr:hypothetical protein [Nitrosovibrio sp. Nv4]SOD41743.1 hypothetical protein SAMN06298226_2045 [Nitrosovibrio sp. Nv4]